MSFQLTIAEGKEAGKEFVFDQASVVIGRTSDCDVILYDPGVSRKHARIFTEGPSYFVEDMGSSNGTKVNGSIVKKKELADGDAISLGPVVFNFSPKVLPEEPEAPAGEASVADQSTRIVAAKDVKRQHNKGVALLPQGAGEKDIQQLSRTATATLQAVKRNSGNMPAVRRATPHPDGDEAPARKGSRSADEAPIVPARKATSESAVPARAGRPGRGGPAALSASDRARIRRESGGMMANFRIFWREASGATRALLSTGLGLVALGVLGAVWYFGLRDVAAGPTRPEPAVLTRQPIPDSFGLGDGVTWHRPDMKVFSFEFSSAGRPVVLLHYQSRDISQGEVVITVNGADVGAVPPDTINAAERSHEVVIPPSTLKKGQPNQIIFDNTKNPPGEDEWRIWNVWVETALLPDLPPDQLVAEADKAFQRAQKYFDQRDVGAENRYMAWKGYREAWLMLEAHPEPKPELYLLARDKVKETQQELDRTCTKLLLEEETYFNHKDWNGARSTLDHIKDFFPGTDQPCAFLGEQKRYEHGL